MSIESTSVRIELALELQRFGAERGGQVICLVVLTDDGFDFAFPAELTEPQLWEVEQAIADSLMDRARLR